MSTVSRPFHPAFDVDRNLLGLPLPWEPQLCSACGQRAPWPPEVPHLLPARLRCGQACSRAPVDVNAGPATWMSGWGCGRAGGLGRTCRAAAPLMGPPRLWEEGRGVGSWGPWPPEPPGIPACATLAACADASRALPHLVRTACFLVKLRVSFQATQTAPIKRVHRSLLAASGRSS